MATGYYIGLGDRTTCGGTVLEGDNRFNIYGVLHSCEGDLVSCGIDGKSYKIYGGISHMTSHGRRMAGTLDSFSGCPCRAKLIPSVFTATYQNEVRPVPQTTTKITQPTNYSDRSTTTNSQLTDLKPAANSASHSSTPKANFTTCPHPDQMEALATYIAGEMNRNIHHPSVLKMKELLSYDVAEETRKQMEFPWYAKIGLTNPQAIGVANGAAAMALFTERVGQGRDWDHKKKIPNTIGGIWHKQGDYDYFYDIWSNIHYGYVGMVGGLSESALSDGAGLEQIASDSLRKLGEKFTEVRTQRAPEKPLPGPHRSGDVEGLRAWDDTPDRISIGIGIQLYMEQPRGDITAKMVMDKVLAVSPTEWGEGVRAHKCHIN